MKDWIRITFKELAQKARKIIKNDSGITFFAFIKALGFSDLEK
jgi:hypothetical protein